MSPHRRTALVAIVAAAILVPPAASAGELVGSGTVRPLAPGACERFPAPHSLVREDCAGVRETFAGTLRSTEPARATQRFWFDVPSGRAWFTGTERFVGCIRGSCGTLALRFRGWIVADLSSSTLRGRRTLVVTSGSGGLAGVRGTVVQRFGAEAGYVATLRTRG